MVNNNPFSQLAEYELRHLVAHLAEAGQAEKLHRLLAYETATRRNAWYQVKEGSGDLVGYIADIARAWHLADLADDVGTVSTSQSLLGLQCRYALLTASTNSTVQNIPIQLLEALGTQK